jgi:hypothetical protein
MVRNKNVCFIKNNLPKMAWLWGIMEPTNFWEELPNSHSLAIMWTWFLRGLEVFLLNMPHTLYKLQATVRFDVLTGSLLRIHVCWNVMGFMTIGNEGTVFL